jgi:hypothetical protein
MHTNEVKFEDVLRSLFVVSSKASMNEVQLEDLPRSSSTVSSR